MVGSVGKGTLAPALRARRAKPRSAALPIFFGDSAVTASRNLSPDLTDEQSFSEANYFGETEYTPAEYYERFMKYYDSVMNAAEAKAAAAEKLSTAQAAYDAAAKEQADAAAKAEAAKKAYDEVAGRKASAEKALEDARAAQASNAEALAAAQAKLAEALAAAQEKLAEAQAAYDDAHAAASAERAVYYAAYPFPDVDMSQYYADGAYYSAVNGLMSGYDNGRFGPNDTLTRGQLATILWRTQRRGGIRRVWPGRALRRRGQHLDVGGQLGGLRRRPGVVFRLREPRRHARAEALRGPVARPRGHNAHEHGREVRGRRKRRDEK